MADGEAYEIEDGGIIYKDKLCIIKTPKKGGIGLNESLEGMCVLAKALYQEKEIEEIKEKFCF